MTVLLLSGSYGFAASWNKTVLAGYGKVQRYKDLFCSQSEKAKSCLYYQKKLGKAFGQKPLRISMTEEDTVWIYTDVAQIKLVKESNGKFLVNGRLIDLTQIQSRAELREAIRKSLPKRSASLMSLFISSAWAQAFSELGGAKTPPVARGDIQVEASGVVDLQVIASIDYLIVTSKSLSSCGEIEKFILACVDKTEFSGRALWQTHLASKSSDVAEKKAQLKVLNEYLKRLNILMKNIKQSRNERFYSSMNSCAKKNVDFRPLINGCVEDIKLASQVLEKLDDKLKEQLNQYHDMQEQISTLAASEDGYDEEHEGIDELQYAPVKHQDRGGSQKSKGGSR